MAGFAQQGEKSYVDAGGIEVRVALNQYPHFLYHCGDEFIGCILMVRRKDAEQPFRLSLPPLEMIVQFLNQSPKLRVRDMSCYLREGIENQQLPFVPGLEFFS